MSDDKPKLRLVDSLNAASYPPKFTYSHKIQVHGDQDEVDDTVRDMRNALRLVTIRDYKLIINPHSIDVHLTKQTDLDKLTVALDDDHSRMDILRLPDEHPHFHRKLKNLQHTLRSIFKRTELHGSIHFFIDTEAVVSEDNTKIFKKKVLVAKARDNQTFLKYLAIQDGTAEFTLKPAMG